MDLNDKINKFYGALEDCYGERPESPKMYEYEQLTLEDGREISDDLFAMFCAIAVFYKSKVDKDADLFDVLAQINRVICENVNITRK